MSVKQETLTQMLLAAFPDAELEVIDTVGDEDHYSVTISSAKFAGLSMIAQHQLVYKALGDIVGNELHALSLKTSAK